MKPRLRALAITASLSAASLLAGIAALAVTGWQWSMPLVTGLCLAWAVWEVLRHGPRKDRPAGTSLRGFCRVYRHCVTSKWWPDYQGGKHPDIGDLSEWERAWSKVLDKGYQDAGTVAPEPRYERRQP